MPFKHPDPVFWLPPTPLKLAIEGNIAAGKSTFIERLQQQNPKGWYVVPEPVASWQIQYNDPCQPKSLLEALYTDTARWSYTFQQVVILAMMRSFKRPPPKSVLEDKNPILFYERSIYTARSIFIPNFHHNRHMTNLEVDLCADWSDYLIDSTPDVYLDGLIYLRCTPDVSYDRLGKRGRPEESGVTKEYLSQLHGKHEAWLHDKTVEKHPSFNDVPILELDCNQEFENDDVYCQALFDKVNDFLKRCRDDQKAKRLAQMYADKENAPVKKTKMSPEKDHAKRNLMDSVKGLKVNGDEAKPLTSK